MKKIVVFASGRGSNAEALYKNAEAYGYGISAIITDNPEAGIIEKANSWSLTVHIVKKEKNEIRESHEAKILTLLKKIDFHLIVLAGYERLLSSTFIQSFARNSIVNIHPSMLPEYPGLRSYERAFEDCKTSSGISIHFVDEGMDTGEIIRQERFSRLDSDSMDSFKTRGLSLEHKLYPEVVGTLLRQKTVYRLEVYPAQKSLLATQDYLKSKIFWIETMGPVAKMKEIAHDVIIDPVVENLYFEHTSRPLEILGFEESTPVEVAFLPGVTDNSAFSTRDALLKHPALKNTELTVYSGSLLYFRDDQNLERKVMKEFANSWLEKATFYKDDNFKTRFTKTHEAAVKLYPEESYTIDLNLSDEALMKLSTDHLWALNIEELHFVRDHFKAEKRNPTDVEMEIIAQTWSEHCKHKIFAASITHEDQDGKREVHSLFKTFIKGATTKILEDRNIDWARSVFTDNAGIVRWDDKLDLCIKVETHNSPSALDPYGGALTGILGVNRDILGCGLGAKPIANTDVFCLPPENLDEDGVYPTELHSPKRLRAGVHKGVQDGGNKSGIPTVNGAFHYHSSYAGKPLVYCGTIGVLPHKVGSCDSHEKNQKPGDLVVMVGGRIGKDGIHGATFSSLELKEGTPSTVVQIGDPLTQKRVTDFLLRARDLELYTSITDNGAGGLSSSVGEMCATTNGARINLALAPVKYPGLTPAELMISESQERMTCSVHPSKWNDFKKLADTFGVEASSLGEFTDDGKLTVFYQDKKVAELSLSFLHDDLPAMKLESTWKPNYARVEWKQTSTIKVPTTLKEKILALLSHNNIRSHEPFVRQYDHEVKASSVTKPFSPSGGPSDAGVIALAPHGGTEFNGVVISSGLAPEVSLQDTKLMAMYSIDEAVRNAVVTGADPDRMVLIDNFCWPDPLPGPRNLDYAQKLGELVRCNEGLYEMAVTYGMPFVSGKDSMKNDAIVNYQGEKTKISVLPTLLVTAMGQMKDIRKTIHSRFNTHEDLWLLGDTTALYPHTLNPSDRPQWPMRNPQNLIEQYKKFHEANLLGLIKGAHDVSEGGVLITLIEMALNSNLGLKYFGGHDEFSFGEGMGLIAFSASKNDHEKIQAHFNQVTLVGETRPDQMIELDRDLFTLLECKQSYQKAFL